MSHLSEMYHNQPMIENEIAVAYIRELEEGLEEYRNHIERSFKRLEMYGVPRDRAHSVCNGIEVLATRFRKELQSS